MALRHEARHHRQGDTSMVWVCQVVRALFYWNPAARSLIRQILAYNVGEKRVEAGIRTMGSRDVWRLIDAGDENDRDYLVRVGAVMVILKNPAVLA